MTALATDDPVFERVITVDEKGHVIRQYYYRGHGEKEITPAQYEWARRQGRTCKVIFVLPAGAEVRYLSGGVRGEQS